MPATLLDIQTAAGARLQGECALAFPGAHMPEQGVPAAGSLRITLREKDGQNQRRVAAFVAVDCSGSMSGRSIQTIKDGMPYLLPASKEEIDAFCTGFSQQILLQHKDQPEEALNEKLAAVHRTFPVLRDGHDLLQISDFSCDAKVIVPKQVAQFDNNALLRRAVDAMATRDSTNIGAAVASLNAFVDAARRDDPHCFVIAFILTDGEDNCDFNTAIARHEYDVPAGLSTHAGVQKLCALDGVFLTAVCLGDKAESRVMASLTEAAHLGDMVLLRTGLTLGATMTAAIKNTVPHELEVRTKATWDAQAYTLVPGRALPTVADLVPRRAPPTVADAAGSPEPESKPKRFRGDDALPDYDWHKYVLLTRDRPEVVVALPLPTLVPHRDDASPVAIKTAILVDGVLCHTEHAVLGPSAPFVRGGFAEACVVPTLQRIELLANRHVSRLLALAQRGDLRTHMGAATNEVDDAVRGMRRILDLAGFLPADDDDCLARVRRAVASAERALPALQPKYRPGVLALLAPLRERGGAAMEEEEGASAPVLFAADAVAESFSILADMDARHGDIRGVLSGEVTAEVATQAIEAAVRVNSNSGTTNDVQQSSRNASETSRMISACAETMQGVRVESDTATPPPLAAAPDAAPAEGVQIERTGCRC